MSNFTETVLEEIRKERLRQREQFSPENDMNHHPTTWVAIACRHLGMGTQDGGLTNRSIYRRQLIRCAAVCAAAVEALDRHMDAIDREAKPVAAEKPDEYARLKEVAQNLADESREPAIVVPAGSLSPVMGTEIRFPFVTLLSQAEPADVGRAVFRAEPQR